MIDKQGADHEAEFPSEAKFVDFSGRTRTFRLESMILAGGYGVHAIEDMEDEGGYQFWAFSQVDAFHALGDLRRRIRKLLAVRHLVEKDGVLTPTHDRLRGRVTYGGVVVDGIFLSFDQFVALIQTYEGSQFDLKLIDPSDEMD